MTDYTRSQSRRPGKCLATTFQEDEVRIMCALVERLLTSGDPLQFVRSPAFVRLARKFLKLREKADRAAIAQAKAGTADVDDLADDSGERAL